MLSAEYLHYVPQRAISDSETRAYRLIKYEDAGTRHPARTGSLRQKKGMGVLLTFTKVV